jgi:hypothetical protein
MSVCWKSWQCVLVGLSVGCLGGCGARGIETVPVVGRVTFEGEPIKEGRIRFFPVEGTAGPMTGTEIQEGQYEVRNRGGVPVGKHRVEIEARRLRRGATGPEMPGVGNPAIEQFIPAKYNQRSELFVTVESGSSKKTLDFDLTK